MKLALSISQYYFRGNSTKKIWGTNKYQLATLNIVLEKKAYKLFNFSLSFPI